MSENMRPELSKNNKYWLERHRYYELKHFCLQYPIWRKAYMALDGLSKKPLDAAVFGKTNTIGDPTARCVEEREYYSDRMGMIEQSALNADAALSTYILRAATEGLSYNFLKARLGIPCCKDTYYEVYRRFLWLLSKERN